MRKRNGSSDGGQGCHQKEPIYGPGVSGLRCPQTHALRLCPVSLVYASLRPDSIRMVCSPDSDSKQSVRESLEVSRNHTPDP